MYGKDAIINIILPVCSPIFHLYSVEVYEAYCALDEAITSNFEGLRLLSPAVYLETLALHLSNCEIGGKTGGVY